MVSKKNFAQLSEVVQKIANDLYFDFTKNERPVGFDYQSYGFVPKWYQLPKFKTLFCRPYIETRNRQLEKRLTALEAYLGIEYKVIDESLPKYVKTSKKKVVTPE